MNREIKFRAWHKHQKEMSEPFLIQDLVRAFDPESEEDYGSTEDVNPPDHPYLSTGWQISNEHIVLQQFTGLKDKNGKEIYEGDIVEYENVRGEKIRQRIVWDERYLRFWLDSDSPIHSNFSYGFHCEVIGNIHKNPEILK